MNRFARGALAAALVSAGIAHAQTAPEAAPTAETQRRQDERRTPPPLPVVTPQQIGIQPPVDPGIAFGKSEAPPLADPIPIRKNFAPEIAQERDLVGL